MRNTLIFTITNTEASHEYNLAKQHALAVVIQDLFGVTSSFCLGSWHGEEERVTFVVRGLDGTECGSLARYVVETYEQECCMLTNGFQAYLTDGAARMEHIGNLTPVPEHVALSSDGYTRFGERFYVTV